MPVTWNATAKAKLMAAIFRVCDVKVSQPQMKELAEIMGSGCTPKAIAHRLSKLRNAGADNADPEAKEDAEQPKTKKAKTTPVSAKKAVRQPSKKRATTPIDSDAEENAGRLTPPTTVDRPQRIGAAKRKYDEISVKEEVLDDEDDGITVGEDIGQGLRATRPSYKSESEGSEMTDEDDG